jgi:hypothetical protein
MHGQLGVPWATDAAEGTVVPGAGGRGEARAVESAPGPPTRRKEPSFQALEAGERYGQPGVPWAAEGTVVPGSAGQEEARAVGSAPGH